MLLRLASLITSIGLAGCGSNSPTAPSPSSTSAPAPVSPAERITDTFTGTISPSDPICTDGLSFHRGKPCLRHPFTMSAPGEIDAFLTTTAGDVDVDLEIWRGSTVVIGSANVAPLTDRARTMDDAGPHEIRVILNSGATAADYTIRVTHPR